MKIGIVAVTNHNYGSLLQSFALQQVVEHLNYETEIINYHERIIGKWKRFHNKEYAISKIKALFKALFFEFRYWGSKKNYLRQRSLAFEVFKQNHLHFSKPCYSQKGLSLLAKSYDTILLGSDQVWHPMNLKMNFFTLNFVPDDIKKIAYAPSFGVSMIPLKMQMSYTRYISRFQYLSCREAVGIKFIEDLTGRKAKLVCDPTILLSREQWEMLLEDRHNIDEKYIFCYFIGKNPNQRVTTKDFAKKKGLKIVSLLHIDEYIPSDEYYADMTPYNVGPLDFLSLVKNAQYVVTDSFHATVFSLIFHKNFFTFNRFEENNSNSTTSRIDNLLELVNLPERKIIANAHAEQLEQLGEIEFQNVDERLKVFRSISLDYLVNALNA